MLLHIHFNGSVSWKLKQPICAVATIKPSDQTTTKHAPSTRLTSDLRAVILTQQTHYSSL